MKKISQKLSHWMFFCLMGGIFPLLFFIIGWWGSIGRVAEDKIFLVAFAGFCWGLLLDYLVLKRIIEKLYTLPLWIMSLVYLFYSVMIYGFFMGFPLFNLVLAVPGGAYMGLRSRDNLPGNIQKMKRATTLFTSCLLFAFCALTAFLALNKKTIGTQLQHMLRLSFAPTLPLIYLLIVIGGFLLLWAHYFLLNHYFEKYVSSLMQSIQPS